MNEDTQKYLERAVEALNASQLLLREHFFPDAISRAYYAMFHAAMAALSTEEVSVKTHKGTINQFHQLFINTGKLPQELGRAFSYAFEKRSSSDYEVFFEITQDTATRIVSDAELFVEAIQVALSKD